MEQENPNKKVEEALYRQAYATAKSVCAAFSDGLQYASASTTMWLDPGRGLKAEVSINFYVS